MSDLIVVRGTDSPLDGMWYDRANLWEAVPLCPLVHPESCGHFQMRPTGEFEEREDGARAEVWVPWNRLLAYILRPVDGMPFRTWASTEAT